MPLLEQRPQSLSVPMPLSVPSISDELLNKLMTQIRPVIQRNDTLFYIEHVHPRQDGFNFIHSIAGEANNLEEIVTITTFHRYGASHFFSPSIAEVMAQIPVGYIDQLVAFKTDIETANISAWPEVAREALQGGFHMAYTTLYKLA